MKMSSQEMGMDLESKSDLTHPGGEDYNTIE